MKTRLVQWALSVGLLGILFLLGFPLVPKTVTNSSAVQAAEKSDLLDLNTATADHFQQGKNRLCRHIISVFEP